MRLIAARGWFGPENAMVSTWIFICGERLGRRHEQIGAFFSTALNDGRVLSLAKPDAGKLAFATIALLIASTSSILIPKFGEEPKGCKSFGRY